MARDPFIRGGTFFVFDGGAGKPIRVGDPAWWRRLDAPGTTRFWFEQEAGGFTARRERREGGWYR